MVSKQAKPNDQDGQDRGGVRQTQQGQKILKPVLGQRRHGVRDLLEHQVSTSDAAEGQGGWGADLGLQEVSLEILRKVHGNESCLGPS